MLKKYKSYTTSNSDLIVFISDIDYLTNTECKATLTFINKNNDKLVEIGRKYVLKLKNIKHWKEYHGKVWKEFPYKTR